jgi:hypothetical protein
MNAPESFIERLTSEFRGRLRLRWSHQRHAWLIEQRIRRGLFPGTRPSKRGWDESSDKYVQHRDGVIEVLEVRTGTAMDCPKCGHGLKVPYGQTTHIQCGFCRMQGKNPHIAAAFLPLNDDLINYLKRIDPENPISERLAEDLDRQNAALAASQERDALNQGDAKFHEDYNRIVGIPQFGYSGRTRMWVDEKKAA